MEASPEQLSRCAAAAEQFTSQGGVQTRVIGWYHSHPHITVLPSHVDIKTQATYQMLDQGFLGLIFSTFNQVDASHGACQACHMEPKAAVARMAARVNKALSVPVLS